MVGRMLNMRARCLGLPSESRAATAADGDACPLCGALRCDMLHVVTCECGIFGATERAAQLARGTTGRPWHLLTVSAQTKASAEAGLLKLADKLAEPDPPELCETAYTLHVGREAYGYRAALVCGEPVAAAAGLRGLAVGERAAPNASVVFAFPGQGSQYFEMGAGLYR